MKNLIYSIFALFALINVTSCSEDIFGSSENKETMVKINLSAPEIATRAYGDGYTALQLQYAVYDQNGKLLSDLVVRDAQMENLKKSIDMKLVTGNKYYMVFFAGAADAPYTVNFTERYADANMVVNNYTGFANAENRDAFFNIAEFEVTSNMELDVKLYRPFAQVNVGTTFEDEAAAKSAGFTLEKTAITATAYKTLNFSTKQASDEVEVKFTLNDIPADSEVFPYNGDVYDYISMNYLMMSLDPQTIDVVLEYSSAEGQTKTRSLGQVPVKRNWRTNIYGQIITSDVQLNVEIIPGFENDENVEIINQ